MVTSNGLWPKLLLSIYLGSLYFDTQTSFLLGGTNIEHGWLKASVDGDDQSSSKATLSMMELLHVSVKSL